LLPAICASSRAMALTGVNMRSYGQKESLQNLQKVAVFALTSRGIDRSGVLARQREGGQAKEA